MRTTSPTGTGRRFAAGQLDQRPPEPGHDGDADGALLLILAGASDDRLTQLRAGQATSAVLLHATGLGLATCPLTQPLEVTRTRQLLRSTVLHDDLEPQLLLRLGWPPAGDPLPATPRRPVDETIRRRPS